ncbi:uncharacterized protein PRCAT00001558001 [Priceomyces carsonii]|uniref:uncharacterized protein n=1 Tax=Priceomyces carsonii TaxID=28549 RepID=UPI002EDA7204|nr:unnamed protein product [Priceomyces carsonii]
MTSEILEETPSMDTESEVRPFSSDNQDTSKTGVTVSVNHSAAEDDSAKRTSLSLLENDRETIGIIKRSIEESEIEANLNADISNEALDLTSSKPIELSGQEHTNLQSQLITGIDKSSNTKDNRSGADANTTDEFKEGFSTALKSDGFHIDETRHPKAKIESVEPEIPRNVDQIGVSINGIDKDISSNVLPSSSGPSLNVQKDYLDNLSKHVPISESIHDSKVPISSGRKNRLVIFCEEPIFYDTKEFISRLKVSTSDDVEVVKLNELKTDLIENKNSYTNVHFCIEYSDSFSSNLKNLTTYFTNDWTNVQPSLNVAFHIQFDKEMLWPQDYNKIERDEYDNFIKSLSQIISDRINQFSVIGKSLSDMNSPTKKDDSSSLKQEISVEFQEWKNLRTLDYTGGNVVSFEGINFPESLEVLNIGNQNSLKSLAGFKMPHKLRSLIAHNTAISSIDNISFSPFLESLDLSNNNIYFLNYVDFPVRLLEMDLSNNRIDNLRGVNFPRTLRSLSLARNPIECIKGVKFPDGIQYLDVSCIPNESMTGVRFPDSIVALNLQESMTNTRGLKLPQFLKEVNLSDNGVNSINPLKLPNSIERLFLSNNNIKTLNKVLFPPCLKDLYLGNNLITTLKNVHFPVGLEVLDLEMDPDVDENDRHITTLKDVIFPPNLKVLKLGHHSIKSIESIEFPYGLECLSLAYNELKFARNIKFGPKLKTLDLSGNRDLINIDHFMIPDSVTDLRIAPQLIENLPAYIIERANNRQVKISKSAPY